MDRILKFISEVKDLGEGRLEITASTEALDRDGDIIRAGGWQLQNFKKNPVILWAHDYHSPPIGRADRVWIDRSDKKLAAEITFADTAFAQDIYKLYQGGFLNTFSVGFLPLDWKYIEDLHRPGLALGREFIKQELLEISCVPLPSNPEALALARSKGFSVPDNLDKIAETYAEAQADLAEALAEVKADDEPDQDTEGADEGKGADDMTEQDKDQDQEPEDLTGEPAKDAEGDEAGKAAKADPVEAIADVKDVVMTVSNREVLAQAKALIDAVLSSEPIEDSTEPDTKAEPETVDAKALAPLVLAGLKGLVADVVSAELKRLMGKVN